MMTTKIFECVAGSRLFGTSVATSDVDLKGVHIPSARSILMQRANVVADASTGSKTASNKPEDTDSTSFPLQRYLALLAKMETNAVEMLFAPNRIPGFYAWDEVYRNRHRILNANKDAFMGFGAAQANRYAVRGQRLETLTHVCDFLAACEDQKLALCKYYLHPIGDLPG